MLFFVFPANPAVAESDPLSAAPSPESPSDGAPTILWRPSDFSGTAPAADYWQLPTSPDLEAAGESGLIKETAPTDVTGYLLEIDRLIGTGERVKALGRLQEALLRYPENPDLFIRAAHLFSLTRRFAIAEEYSARLAALLPSNAWAQACWGGLLLRDGKSAKAEAVLQEALKLNPTDLTARYNLACLRLSMDRPDALQSLQNLSVEEIGRLCTWLHDERDVLPGLISKSGYQTLCEFVMTGRSEANSGTSSNELAAMDQRVQNTAQWLWTAYRAMQTSNWPAALPPLQNARDAGVHPQTLSNQIDRIQKKALKI